MEKFSIEYVDNFKNATFIYREIDDDLDIYTAVDYFKEFLRGAGYSENLINEVLK